MQGSCQVSIARVCSHHQAATAVQLHLSVTELLLPDSAPHPCAWCCGDEVRCVIKSGSKMWRQQSCKCNPPSAHAFCAPLPEECGMMWHILGWSKAAVRASAADASRTLSGSHVVYVASSSSSGCMLCRNVFVVIVPHPTDHATSDAAPACYSGWWSTMISRCSSTPVQRTSQG
jgi:hypothetical protein